MAAKLERSTSVYLNAIRFFAACIVFLGHISGQRFTRGFLWPTAAFMDIAVMVFFVLSGFVIAYVTEDHERDLRTYAINRIARIYSVALPALILALVLDSIGRHFRPELYSISWGFSAKYVWLQFLAGATFTHRLWWAEISPGSILPYWSLGYEVWYYVIFAVFFYLRGQKRYWLTGLACLIAGPEILSLFPVWLFGFAVYQLSKRELMPKWAARAILYASAGSLLVLLYFALHGFHPPRTIIVRYVVGALFGLNIIAIRAVDFSPRWLGQVTPAINWFAGLTFSLYLFHVTVAQFLVTLLPAPPASTTGQISFFVGTFLIVAVLAEFTERKKNVWRSAVAVGFSLLSRARREVTI